MDYTQAIPFSIAGVAMVVRSRVTTWPSAGLIAFAVQGLRALGYADAFWEWQWVTRDKGMLPKH